MNRDWQINYLVVLAAAFVVVLCDILLLNYMKLFFGYEPFPLIVTDVIVVVISGVGGLAAIKKLELPAWISSIKKETLSRAGQSLTLGLIVVLVNTLITTSVDSRTVAWLSFNHLGEPLLLSLRAAITEEFLFRFLIFSAAAVLFRKVLETDKYAFLLGAVASSLLFGLLHTGFLFAFVNGMALCYIFKNSGLLPAVLVHFLADALPFSMVSLR